MRVKPYSLESKRNVGGPIGDEPEVVQEMDIMIVRKRVRIQIKDFTYLQVLRLVQLM